MTVLSDELKWKLWESVSHKDACLDAMILAYGNAVADAAIAADRAQGAEPVGYKVTRESGYNHFIDADDAEMIGLARLSGYAVAPVYTRPQPDGETDWERMARVQDAKLRAAIGEKGAWENLCEVMDRYKERPQPVAVPDVLFDSYAVFKRAEATCPSLQAHQVGHVLDAVVYLMREAGKSFVAAAPATNNGGVR